MAEFELRQYQDGVPGWVAHQDLPSMTRLIIHIKNSENPFGNLVIKDEKQAMALRNLLGDFLLMKAKENES